MWSMLGEFTGGNEGGTVFVKRQEKRKRQRRGQETKGTKIPGSRQGWPGGEDDAEDG